MRALVWLMVAALTATAGCGKSDNDTPPAVAAAQDADASAETRVISGRLEDGLRVLTFDPAEPNARFTIYRGDYVRPELVTGAPFTIEIPDLGVTMSVPVPEGERPYFKVPQTGAFTFHIGTYSGLIEAVDYTSARYREVSARDAAAFISELRPVVLDVRTPREYAAGHLEGAILIPVQNLARRLDELDEFKDRPLLVYCASGNRSTVAGQMLVKAGFSQVVNMRHGIAEWTREGLPVVTGGN